MNKLLRGGLNFRFLLLLPISLLGQFNLAENVILYPDTNLAGNGKYKVSLWGDYSVNASSIPNYFLGKALYQGAYLDDQIKQTAVDRLKSRNRIGLDAKAELSFSMATPKLRYRFALGHREFFSMKFSEDVFKLIFLGNKDYLGKTADVSKLKLSSFNYEYLSIGAEKNVGKTTIVGANLNILRGSRFVQFSTERGELFTEQFGSYLDLNAKLEVNTAPNDTSKSLEMNGLGTSMDFYFRTQKGKSVLEASVQDVGFISWKDCKHYYGDSTFRYSGQQINDLLDPNSSLVASSAPDSVAKMVGIKTERKNTLMWLPFQMNLSWRYTISAKMTHQAILRYMAAPGYIPRISYRHYYKLSSSFYLLNTISYGGFGRGDYELGVAVNLKDKWVLTSQLHFAEYVLAGKHTSGNGFNIGITGVF